MMQRTGRSSEALSRAVDALVKRGLIEVRNEDDELLATPNQRRRCGGRLYFSVKNGADNCEDVDVDRKSEEVNPVSHPTGYKSKGSNPKTASRTGKSEVPGRKSEEVAGKSGVRKANTTKETQTKYKDKKKDDEIEDSFRQEKPNASANASGFGSAFGVSAAEVSRFLNFYRELRAEYGNSRSPSSDDDQGDPGVARELLHLYGFERLMDLLLRFLRDGNGEKENQQRDCSLHAFKASIKRLLVEETRERLLRPRVDGGWSRAGAE